MSSPIGEKSIRACLEAISTYTPSAILILDNHEVVNFANQKFLDLFNISIHQIRGKNIKLTDLPDDFLESLDSRQNMSFPISLPGGKKERQYLFVHPIVTDSYKKVGNLLLIEPEPDSHGEAIGLDLKGESDSAARIEKMSHNLKTPLNSILGYCQLMMGESGLSKDQKKYLNTISENSFRLLNQINVLLDEKDEIQENGTLPVSVQDKKTCGIEKILIVDDVSINRTFLRIMLERHGYQLIEAQNGKEALDRIILDCPDLVLMDIMMPVMDGLETLEIIRSYDDRLSELPVIAVTANSRRGNREKLINAGFNGYLQKPFKEEDLIEMISA
ncbi:MAG: response regulator [Balneolaceae bacterium]